ncbi:MAG: hypothetical protein WB507_01700 [Solirubrobacterales bacterium]
MRARRPTRTALLVAVVLASLAAASPALGNRSVAKHMAGGVSVAFAANNNVWITDTGQEGLDNNPGQNGLYEYDAYPSQTLLEVPNTFSVWSYYILDLQAAVDQENGEVFVAQSNGRTIDIFAEEEKHKFAYSHSWTAINGDGVCFSCTPIIHVAIDNSHSYSRGRVYLSLTSPEDDVEAFDAAERPVDFPATANYISNNKLTGTPSGSFGEVGHVAVDNNGNVYVTDVEKQVIDEFDSSGTFVRTLPCEGCSDGYPVGSGAVGVDPTNGNIIVGTGGRLNEYDSSGNQLNVIEDGGAPAVNSEGYLYSSSGTIYTPVETLAKVGYKPVTLPTTTSGTLNAEVEPNGGGNVTECQFEYAEQGAFNASNATNAAQTVNISGASGGTFTLSFDGQTTSATGAGNLSAATGKGSLAAGSKEVTSLTTKTGGFAVGQLISGPGIPSGTTIAKTGTGTLELSQQATEHVSGANLTAGSKTVNDLTTEAGVFAVGESITGSGIPSGTTITEINSGSLELSQPATKAATAEPITAGTILTYDSDAGTVQSAIEGMSTIGPNNVVVSGSVGGPYSVEFVGRLARSAITALTADSSSLTPPGATASVITTVKGGRWEGATEVPCLNEGNEEVDTHPIPSASPSAQVHGVIAGLAAGKNYEYRVTVRSANGSTYGASQPYTTGKVPDLTTDPATNLTEDSATLNASFVGDGSDTHYYFEWGPTVAYGNLTAAPPGDDAGSPTGPARTPNSTELTGLEPYSTYHYRVIASNGSGTSQGRDQMFTTTPGAPTAQSPAVTVVHSDRAIFHGEVDPNGTPTKASFEYVENTTFQQSGWAHAEKTSPEIEIGMSKHYQSVSQSVDGLAPDTLYHYRVVGNNDNGSGNSAATFTTFAFTPSFNDPCPNAHVRQQTGTSLLLDCRAYELVSAANAGGYDVESNLVPGETPFAGYPEAENPSQVLYGVHDGGIPGTGHPTNNGVDPYVATRTESGWNTKYVGIPANDPFASGPFSSSLEEADASLDTLAFGGPHICSPCFEDHSTGIPVHRPNGELVQGMAGLLPQPAGKPAGFIGRRLSADGTHLVFGSKSKFEPDANEGEISIYDRNLNSEETHVVSKTPEGQTMKEEGKEIGELDISKNGSRIVIGHLVSEVGNARYWHLYMNIGDSGKTIDLTPGTTHGVLFDGMTADGSKVFFSSVDHLTGQEPEHSGADIFEAEISEGGATLHLISKGQEETSGAPGDTSTCDPAANTKHEHWNTTGSEENCGVVAVGGGSGVASGDGTIYFLSPEKLDGSEHGVQNAPNLYVSRPGQPPHFVATLESSANAPLPLPSHPFLREFGAFSNPTGVAIEHSTGDFYGLDVETTEGTGYVYKFNSSGQPVVTFGTKGALTVSGMWGLFSLPTELAVDQSNNHLYIPFLFSSVVKEYDSSGNAVGEIHTSLPTGVAVDQANGLVYVSSLFGEITIYEPNGTEVSSFSTGFSFPTGPTSVAVDSTGKVYVSNGGGLARAKGITKIFSSSGTQLGILTEAPSKGLAVDPSDNHVYVDEGGKVVEFDSSGNQVNAPTGAGLLSGSIGLAVDSGTIGVSNPGQANIATFGPAVVPPDQSTDNPLVVDSVSSPGTPDTADFQVSPSGNYAVFPSTLPFTGYNNAANPEVFRYDASTEGISCASCNPTTEEATGEATLASDGLSLTNDGRVFFNSTEGLVDRDLNGKMDVYEWSPQLPTAEVGACHTEGGCVELISTGTSPFNSSLLGASANGTDAFFFTRDTLVTGDENGTRVKIYDARVDGGFPQVPPPHECQASDECHGAGTQAPSPPDVKTVVGTPVGNAATPTKCAKGRVKKLGRCVKRHRPHRHHKSHHKAHRHG